MFKVASNIFRSIHPLFHRCTISAEQLDANKTSSVTTTTEMLICPGWKTLVISVFQPGMPGRDKRLPFVPIGNTNRDKKCCQRHVAGAPFCPGWCYQPGQKVSFFLSCFLFLNSFSISIILLYFN